MSEPYLGEIRMFGFNFAPAGWAFCQGQLMSISQNTALFSILGTTYGGNGTQTFALPDLSGAAPLHAGQGSGLTQRSLGETGGASTVTLTTDELPAHNHPVAANNSSGSSNSPSGRVFGASQARAKSAGYVSGTPTVAMSSQAVISAGGGSPHNNMPPYLALNFCIALQGVFPTRP